MRRAVRHRPADWLCVSPLANKSADQAVRKIMLQNWNSKGYNIDADIGFDELKVADVDKAKEDGGQLEQAAASAADQIARSMRLNIKAALDVPGGKLELIPALRLERRNLLTSVQLPLQFHAKDLSLLVDPSAAYLFVPEMQAYEGKFLRVRLPQRVADNFPLQAMYQAMPKLLDEAYAKVDKTGLQLPAAEPARGGTGRALPTTHRHEPRPGKPAGFPDYRRPDPGGAPGSRAQAGDQARPAGQRKLAATD
ncbi:hypothetical protein JOS77_01345 [Chromobacterium haemolyticum]|nr:hypothetical protein JOS77_01345 [Chromobacterium haemolyticum]